MMFFFKFKVLNINILKRDIKMKKTAVTKKIINFREKKIAHDLDRKINSVVKDIIKGKPVIVVDSIDRENEGDLVISAEKANIDNVTFCMRYARGLMCVPCNHKILS